MLKPLLLLLGLVFFGLGFVGAFIPGLPTTPFMLLALWCFARSSERFHQWLLHHKIFGPPIQRWEKHRVISLKAKAIAVVSMALSFGYLLYFRETSLWVLLMTGSVMGYGAWYILTKPSVAPSSDGEVVRGEGQ